MTASNTSHGRLAALAFTLGATFFALAFALRVAPSVMVADLMRAFGVGGAVLGNLSAFYFYAYAGLQIPVGLLLDRFGPRRLMTLAALGVAIGTLVFATAAAIETAYAGRLLIGIGCAFSWVGTLAIVNRWFPSRFALLAGVSQLIAMGGAMLGQAPLAAVIERAGWRPTMTGLAAVAAVLAVALWLAVRDRPRPAAAGRAPPRAGTVLGNPQTWYAAWFGLTMSAPVLAFGGLWGVPWLTTVHGVDRTSAAAIVSLIFLGHGMGGTLFGWWSDRIARRRLPMLLGAALSVGAQLAYLLAPGLPLPVVATLVLVSGIGGSTMILAFACAREHNPLPQAGFTIGIVNTAVVGSGALLQPLVGWLLDRGWEGALVDGARVYPPEVFGHALLVPPLLGVSGIAVLAALRETYARQRER